jgi:hypothetical protein
MYVTKAELEAPGGSSLVGFKQSGTGTADRLVQDKLRETVSTTDFTTVQAALDEVANPVDFYGKTASMPASSIVPAASMELKSFTTFRGDSRYGTVFNNQTIPLAAPQLVNQNGGWFSSVAISDFRALGGTHFLKSTLSSNNTEDILISRVVANLQSEAGIEFDALQVSHIADSVFGDANYGIKVNRYPCNANLVTNVQLNGCKESYLKLTGFEVWMDIGGRMEGFGAAGKYTIDLAGQNVGGEIKGNIAAFSGKYFETTHEYLLKARNTYGVVFDACHMTGYKPGEQPFTGYKFDCASDLIEFGTNYWFKPTAAPRNVLIRGRNDNLRTADANVWTTKADTTGRIKLADRRGTSTGFDVDLIEFARPSVVLDAENISGLSGILTLNLDAYKDGFPRYRSVRFAVRVNGWRGFNMSIDTSPIAGSDQDTGAFGLALSGVGAAPGSVRLNLVVTNLHDAQPSIVTGSFEWDSHSYVPGNEIQVTPL